MSSDPHPIPLEPGAASIAAEQDLWQDSYSPRAMAGAWIWGGLATVAVIAAGVVMKSPAVWTVAIGAVVVLWIWELLVLISRRLGVRYRLTTQRFIHERGVLMRKVDRLELLDIDDVSFTQSLFERMLGVGTIKLVTSDKTSPSLTLLGIADVEAVADKIDTARRAERRAHAVHIESI